MTLSVSINHAFDDFRLNVEFVAPPGVTALFGPSGSGKSTIINAIAGLLKPDAARILNDTRALTDTQNAKMLPPHRRRIATVFQDARLFPHMTVQQNLNYGARFADARSDPRDVDRLVDVLGLGDLLQRRPATLSGGEMQRVAIGRALLSQPETLLADEPLSALDGARKEEILTHFEWLKSEMDIPILYVSHSRAEVARLADKVIALSEGRVVREGSPHEVFSDPAMLGAGLNETGVTLTTRVVRRHDDGLLELDAGGQRLYLPAEERTVGSIVEVWIAAQDVLISADAPSGLSALNTLPGQITAREDVGRAMVLVRMRCSAGPITALVTRRSASALDLQPGQTCHAIIKTAAIAQRD